MKTIAYVRVSTDTQDCKNQRYEILSYCDRERWQVDRWLELEISSRRSLKERRIEELLEALSSGDRLIVSELSRLGRSTGEVIEIVKSLTDRRVEFVAIKQGLRIGTNGAGQDLTAKVMITIFSLLAELERDLISERTKVALANAKAQGKKLGRPAGVVGKSRLDGKEEEIRKLMKKGVTRANIAKILDVSWGTLENFLNKHGMK